jgi:CxxC-x17-CxxC domain-containing protein
MGFTDKNITCADCGKEFVFSAADQEFHASKGFTNEPKRCTSCREQRRSTREGNSGGRRQMYPATCAECGKQTEIPFEPKSDRPVYCSNCYDKIKARK